MAGVYLGRGNGMASVSTLKRIKAIAEDLRGDPNTRAVAIAKLEEYRAKFPEAFEKLAKRYFLDDR
jgi:hypothetical protein